VSKRTYREFCPIARSLDLLGERWTLLIVRELLLGPKRFKDLLAALSPMGSNRLASRLKELQGAGVVAKRLLPAAADVSVYELTAYGERLRPVLYSLGEWGSSLPLPPDAGLSGARAELMALGISATCPPALSADLEETYELHVGSERFHVSAVRGSVTVRSGPAPARADLLVECDLGTFRALLGGRVSPSRALREGRVSVVGDARGLRRVFQILSDAHQRPTSTAPAMAWTSTAAPAPAKASS